VESSTATPQTWVALLSVPRWDGLTGLFADGGTKKATSRGRVGSLASTTRMPSEYQEMKTSVPFWSGLWMV
jgi:hypothetical protein